MIDLDCLEDQLASAVTDVVRVVSPRRQPRPVGAPAAPPVPASSTLGVRELMEQGLVSQADARIAETPDRRDALTWATMRALLDGRQDAARSGMDELLGLARASGDPDTEDRYWAQRYWATLEWGSEGERYDVLGHCRERAYRFDDLPWWGNLTLLLATLGKEDEATRAFDATSELLGRVAKDGRWLDVVTNLIEAAALLGDPSRAAAAARPLRWPAGRLVVVGPGVVCKGSVDRYVALGHAAAAQWGAAADAFRRAEAVHRAIGAAPLLARTLQQASGTPVAA